MPTYISLGGESGLDGRKAAAALGERDTGDARVGLRHEQGAAAVEHQAPRALDAVGDELRRPALRELGRRVGRRQGPGTLPLGDQAAVDACHGAQQRKRELDECRESH